MSRYRGETFTMLGGGLRRHVRRTGIFDRWRRVPERIEEGAAPPAHLRLEEQTRSGLARRGADFYEKVAKIHDPIVARATARAQEAEQRVQAAKAAEAEAAMAARAVTPSGGAADPSRQIHRRARLARGERVQAEAAMLTAESELAEVAARRAAAAATARHKGYEHLALGQAAVHGYWEWLLRARRRRLPQIPEASSGLAPMDWMVDAEGKSDSA